MFGYITCQLDFPILFLPLTDQPSLTDFAAFLPCSHTLTMRSQVRSPMAALAAKKLTLDITLNDQQDAYVSSYTTLDKIEGEVTITALSDAPFNDVLITFEGEPYHRALISCLAPTLVPG